MRVPLSWLCEYVDINLPVPELAERMTARNRITEGLALMGSGLALGLAAGNALAGLTIDAAGPGPALGLAAAFATAAMAAFWPTSPMNSRSPSNDQRHGLRKPNAHTSGAPTSPPANGLSAGTAYG